VTCYIVTVSSGGDRCLILTSDRKKSIIKPDLVQHFKLALAAVEELPAFDEKAVKKYAINTAKPWTVIEGTT